MIKISVSNQLVIDDPTDEMYEWVKKNLVIANPDYIKKQRMGFWTGSTPKTIQMFEKHGNKLVLPYGTLRNLPQSVMREANFINDFHHAVDIPYGNVPIPLYDYQEDAVESVYNAKTGILQSAAGSGKTQMGIALIKKFGKRALWLTHTKDLLDQSKARAEDYIYEDMIGTITEGEVDIGEGVTFATIQTMSNLDLESLRYVWDVIIVDECHRVSGTPSSVTMFYKVLNNLSARHKIGLSATVHRADGMIAATYALLGNVVYKVPDSAIADKIMKVGVKPVETGLTISSSCLNTDGTINNPRLIAHLVEDDDRNELIVRCMEINKGKPSLILSDRIKHLEKLKDMLPEDMKKDAVLISGKMMTNAQKEERRQAIQDMRDGKKTYIFASYSLAKEGLDIPRLERLYLTTPQKDYAVITQSIGRVARTSEGKADPIVYDFVDNIRHLIKAYKLRCATYRKNGCYFVEDE